MFTLDSDKPETKTFGCLGVGINFAFCPDNKVQTLLQKS